MTSKAEVSEKLGSFTFLWKEYDISIIASRVQTHKTDNRVTGEVLIKAQNGDDKLLTIYPPTTFNFSADRTRKELSNSLTKKYPKIPWPDMIDQLCYGIMERARQGEPVQHLVTADDIQPPEYLINPLIVKNYPNVIFGDPGAFKSNLALALAQVMLLPWYDNPMGVLAPSKSYKSLYLDWETDAQTIIWQTTMLKNGTDIGAMMIDYRKCFMPIANDLERIQDKIIECEADIIIIDSLGLAAGGDLNETQPALAFYAGLRGLNITSLILAHNSKDREGKNRSIYGNQMYTAQARNVWEVRKHEEPGADEIDLALFHKKPPPFSGLHAPIGFKVVFDKPNKKMNILPSDVKNTGSFLEQMSLATRIKDVLAGGSSTQEEIAEQTGADITQVRVRLYDLKKRGDVRKDGLVWSLSLES